MMPRLATTNVGFMIVACTVAVCAAFNLAVLAMLLLHPAALNTDFLAFWSFPRFAARHAVGRIYDAGALQAFQKALYPGFGSFYPYLYPPTFLLASWWLKFLPFRTAELVWSLGGLALLSGGVWAFFARRRRLMLVVLLAAPASLLNMVTGETAYFTSGLLLLGLAALPARPVLAGIAFGLLTLKPQLGMLIPVLLLARGDWAAMLSAAVTAGLLIAVSCAVFPPGLWLLWFHTLPAYQTQYFSGGGLNLNIIVTPAANLVALHVPQDAAWLVQTLFGAAAVTAVFWAGRCVPYRLAAGIMLAASFLAVPHAYAYDSVTLDAAMALYLTRETRLWQVLLGCAVYLAPLMLLTPAARWFLYSIPETLLLACMIALALPPAAGAILRDEPEPVSASQR